MTVVTVEARIPSHIADQLLRALILVDVATSQGRQRNTLPSEASEWVAASKSLHDRLAVAIAATPDDDAVAIELGGVDQRAAYAATGSALVVLDGHPADAARFGFDRRAIVAIRAVMTELRGIRRQVVGMSLN